MYIRDTPKCLWKDLVALFDRRQRPFFEAVSRLGFCNPFLPERVEYEHQVLGEAFEEGDPVWSMQVADPDRRWKYWMESETSTSGR
jgi:hypothetical protein